MDRGYQSACECGLRSGIHIVALECCCELPRTFEIRVTKSTTHKKVGALEIIPVGVSVNLIGRSVSISLTALDLQGLGVSAVRSAVDQRVCGLQGRLVDQYFFDASYAP